MSNEAMRDYWNADAGSTWAAMHERLDWSLSPVTEALIGMAAPAPGERVLDIGCGSGETSLILAQAVGEDGDVLGVDISQPLLAIAHERADALDSPALFLEADAAMLAGDASRDLLVSRFGVMFFDQPEAAFANLRSHAKPGARLHFACWRTPADNDWATAAQMALAPMLPEASPADPLAPGPFAFADPARLLALLEGAGWQEPAVERLDFAMTIGRGKSALDDAVDFSLRVGPAARAVREAGPALAGKASEALRAAYASRLQGEELSLPGSVWLVSALA